MMRLLPLTVVLVIVIVGGCVFASGCSTQPGLYGLGLANTKLVVCVTTGVDKRINKVKAAAKETSLMPTTLLNSC